MKQVKQFRYYGFNNPSNYPKSLSYSDLISGNIFRNLGFVLHIGVQAIPGTQFYLNNSNNPITVGSTGIYELNLEGMGQIFAIKFSKASLEHLDETQEGLLIDILYEGASV